MVMRHSNKKKVVLGFLGTKLDAGVTDKRWERWRPTVALYAHDDFQVDQLDLFISHENHLPMAQRVADDIRTLNEFSEVNAHMLDIQDPWNFQQVYAALFDFAKNYDFRDDCEYYVHLTTGTHVAQICLFLLLEARYFPARIIETKMHGEGKSEKAGKSEAWRGAYEVIDLDLSTYDQLATRFHKESQDSQELLKGGIATRNARFNALIRRIEQVAIKSKAPMLLCGPTGAGKSQLAKRIYDLRLRRHLVQGSLVEVNCATLRGDNAMSALFGHKKGAFTGAVADRQGLLKAADGGVIFLDEIGELGLEEQAMLLRALEEKVFTPMGSDKEIKSDFQLLAGTNVDLARAVAEGTFRSDLLARLNVWQFILPGLADRRDDIEPNLDYELERTSALIGSRVTMTREAREAYMAFAMQAPWQGNFRDLAASVMRMATLCEAGRISADDVQMEIETLLQNWGMDRLPAAGGAAATPALNVRVQRDLVAVALGQEAQKIDLFDRVQLQAVLEAVLSTTSMAQAGRQLFAVSREGKENPNDSDRVRKFLGRWGLEYRAVREQMLQA